MIEIVFPALLAIIFAEALWQVLLTFWNWITYERKKDMSDKYVTLDEFMNERGEWVKQIVYKVDGDFNGDIKGENVTVILMGNGDFKGDINSKDGTVFLNKGNVIGDIKADKVLCPTNNKIKPNCRMCKSYMAKGLFTGQIYCYKHGLLNDSVPCSDFVKGDQL